MRLAIGQARKAEKLLEVPTRGTVYKFAIQGTDGAAKAIKGGQVKVVDANKMQVQLIPDDLHKLPTTITMEYEVDPSGFRTMLFSMTWACQAWSCRVRASRNFSPSLTVN